MPACVAWSKSGNSDVSNVTDLDSRRPHQSGEARCTDCRHDWIAVAPVGTDWLDCPACGLSKGRFRHPSLRGSALFTCHCGCDVFHLAPAGPYCVNCSDWANGWDLRPMGPVA